MLYLCHLLIVTAYTACPVWAVTHALRARRRDRRAARRVRRAIVGGIAVGTGVCVIYGVAAHGRPSLGQVAITAYFATSFILLLGVCDRCLWRTTQALFRLTPGEAPGPAFGTRVTAALLLRAAVVGGVGIPYVLAVAFTYRPRMAPTTNPSRLYGWTYERVTFPATVDSTRIAGWWIPAPGGPSTRTLVLCPGETGGPAAALPLARDLHFDGYNILAFSFRAHGDSGGQLVSFGDLERRDVLGAVRWLGQTHPAAARRVVGLGVSSGAAALLAAAADPSPLGQSIDAVAVYAPYDRLSQIVASTVAPLTPPPLAWLVEHVSLPLAGLQVGADLPAFSPANAARNLWPRPLLVVHGMDDEVIPFAQGQAVYDAASEPKQCLWIGQCGHAESLKDDAALGTVRRYFDAARRMI